MGMEYDPDLIYMGEDGEYYYDEEGYPYDPEGYPYDADGYPYDPDSQFDYYYGNEEVPQYVEITTWEMVEKCVWPSLSQSLWMLMPLLILCLVQRVSCSLFWQDREIESHPDRENNQSKSSDSIPAWVLHTGSLIWGLLACHLFFDFNLVYLVALAVVIYPVFMLSYKSGKCGLLVALFTVIFLLSCEFYVVEEEKWHRIRGSQIVIAMKVISLGFDLDSGHQYELPTVFEYAGYVFHVGSVVFGPWVSFQDYYDLLKPRGKTVSRAWVMCLVKSFSLGLLCVLMSNCLVPWYFMTTTYSWVAAYRDAQSFRFSHYFVSFISEVTSVLTGLGSRRDAGDVQWSLQVARPQHIEVPRSLVEVVTNWNLPMHYWLRNYVFKMARPLGVFTAILLTYAASSLLHGLNFQLAAVLLSLGFYSYTEYVLRNRLSRIFDACIQAKRCKECQHTYTAHQPYVIATNLAFGLLSIFHLAYLGLMFDSSDEEEKGYSMDHTLSKWSDLNYASHWVALGSYLVYLVI